MAVPSLTLHCHCFFFSPSLLISGVDHLIELLTRTESFFTSICHVCLPVCFLCPCRSRLQPTRTSLLFRIRTLDVCPRLQSWRGLIADTRARISSMDRAPHASANARPQRLVIRAPQTIEEKAAGRFEPSTLGVAIFYADR